MVFALLLFVIACVLTFSALKVVPEENAWVVERLGKYHNTLAPGLNVLVPFLDRVAYKHSLRETSLEMPGQVCTTRDNVQLLVDGVLFLQVTDPMRASYGASDYLVAVTELAQVALRGAVGRMPSASVFEERGVIGAQVTPAVAEAALSWGVKVLRYEIKDLVQV